MVNKRNKNHNLDYDEDLDEDYEENEGDLDEDSEIPQYKTHSSGAESIVEKPTIDNFFNTEQLLQEIEKTMKGYQKIDNKWIYNSLPKARDSFINSMINRLRSVINQQNMISYMEQDDIKFLLLEKNKDFIFSVYDEPSIDDEDVESVINIYDHAMQIFMGQILLGFGARTLRQISAAVSYEVENKKQNDGLISFGYGDKNLLKIGGEK